MVREKKSWVSRINQVLPATSPEVGPRIKLPRVTETKNVVGVRKPFLPRNTVPGKLGCREH